MLSTSTPETVNPVADACEAAGRAAASRPSCPGRRGTSAAARSRAASHRRSNGRYHFSFGVGDFAERYISQWNGPVKTNKKVGVLWPNDADGNAIRAILGPLLQKAGFTIVDPGAVRGRHDRLLVADHEVQDGELPDLQHVPAPARLRDLLAAGGAAGLHEAGEDRADRQDGPVPLADRRARLLGYNLASACYWRPTFPYKSPLPDLTSKQLADGYDEGDRHGSGTSSSARPWRCSTSGSPRSRRAATRRTRRRSPRRFKTLKVTTPVGSGRLRAKARSRTSSRRRSSARSG